uniref:C-type lectin domain-containing protein n=1 Tax=Lates calcarifer TaxID=8187 RepID=A0A4W6FTW8_LATCA
SKVYKRKTHYLELRVKPIRSYQPNEHQYLSCSCYLFSDESGSWDQGRENCRARGADLVVIDSPKEQVQFTSGSAWIGLSDRDEEGTWKWVNKTPLNLVYWEKIQPDNGGGDPQWGEEDCAEIRSDGWNDLSCDASLRWICEKLS